MAQVRFAVSASTRLASTVALVFGLSPTGCADSADSTTELETASTSTAEETQADSGDASSKITTPSNSDSGNENSDSQSQSAQEDSDSGTGSNGDDSASESTGSDEGTGETSATSESESESDSDSGVTETSSDEESGGDSDDTGDDHPVEDVIRIHIDWGGESNPDAYSLGQVLFEKSGTTALHERSKQQDPRGSFRGYVRDAQSEEVIYQAAIGIGQYFRTLERTLSFRFPALSEAFLFTMEAENSQTGEFEEVARETIDPSTVEWSDSMDVEVMHLRDAQEEPSVLLTFYAEAYEAGSEDRFFASAQEVVLLLEEMDFPGFSRLAFDAAFYPSNEPLGPAQDLGLPVPVPDTFLGMYFPYWCGSWFSRWNVILYPTNEDKYRSALGQVPYDYPFILADSSAFWGAGNYNAHTAIPAGSSSLDYLLPHEFGHFFGLNEEYSGGGTELFFGDGVDEPFSQNLSFTTDRDKIPWADLIDPNTPLPTQASDFNQYGVGGYRGGYAGMDSRSHLPVPSGQCIMSTSGDFCDVCRHAIQTKIDFDAGVP